MTKPTILVADDEARIRRLVGDFLKVQGYNILEAKDGREALDVFNEHGSQISLIILDIMMPQLDGWQVLSEIRTTLSLIHIFFFLSLFTRGGEFSNSRGRGGLRGLTAGIGINFGIENKNVHVFAGGQHMVQAAVTDIIGPTVAAEGPNGFFHQVVFTGIDLDVYKRQLPDRPFLPPPNGRADPAGFCSKHSKPFEKRRKRPGLEVGWRRSGG